MIRNGEDIPEGTELVTEVCIVGSGPAGITAAWYLQQAGVKVTLLEGSRALDYRRQGYYRQSWSDKVKLYEGLATGLFAGNEPDFLVLPTKYSGDFPQERERVYGGTSNHWGGQSRPLDPLTFEKRPGFPGWPIGRKELDPYYKEAAALCMLAGSDFSTEYWARQLHAEVPKLAGFDVEMYQFVGPNWLNFATRPFNGKPIASAPIDVIVNASLLEIEHTDGAVKRLHVASMKQEAKDPELSATFTIRADLYVLACGAVANAQQLLWSKAGNEHGLVGRYFMCHPLAKGGTVRTTQSYLNPQEWGLMDGNGWVGPNGVTVTGRFVPAADQVRQLEIGQCWFWAGEPYPPYDSSPYYFEMTPNRDSRITLTDTLDSVFGKQQVHIDWQLSPRDQRTYEQTTALFGAATRGATTFLSWDEVKDSLVVNGHHIGTTRMSASSAPAEGVVNENLQVHSISNLFVAGASVFPSAGISNPTFTIIALSIRLAGHLKKLLGKQAA